MRILTIRPPWSAAIFDAGKNVENRTWQTHYRGPILIHAGRLWDHAIGPTYPDSSPVPDRKDVIHGAIIGVVILE